MKESAQGCHGLRFTPRHQLILALYFTLLTPVLVVLVPHHSFVGALFTALRIVLLSLWALGLLILVLDRPGPIKNWVVPLILSAFFPVLAAYLVERIEALLTVPGITPDSRWRIGLAAFFVTSFAIYLSKMLPRRCPACSERSLIPLLRLWGRVKRTAHTRWCASCGSLYWRHGKGPWQPERRTTWVETSHGPAERGMRGHLASKAG